MNPIQNAEVCWACVVHVARRGRGLLVTLVTAALILSVPAAAFADGRAGEITKDAGVGIGSALVTLVYAPLKIAYATGGLVVGGLAWAFSGGNSQVAAVVFTPSLRGDYVVTPDHLSGKQEFEFFGREQTDMSQTNVAAGPDGWEEGW